MNRLISILLIFFISFKLIESSPILFQIKNLDIFDRTLISPNIQNDFESTLAENFTYRLPNDTIPLEYDITISTNVHKGLFDFSGHVNITLKAIKQTDKIVIHYRQLDILQDNCILQDKDKHNLTIKISKNEKADFLIFTLDKMTLKANEIYNLIIDYKGKLRTDNGGFYLSSYKNSKGADINLATTQFESTDARHGFPCYDEPGFKAQFTITIVHGINYTAISNMPVEGNLIKNSTHTTTRFQKTPIMSTYLIAYVISNFESTSGHSSNDPKFVQRVFSRPDTKDEQEFALTSGLGILSSIEKYLDINYLLPKMDQVAIPDFAAGAMENWGLVTYREEALLYNRQKSTIFSQTSIANIISHEYGHQWFGNLVSPKWWQYLWLNEGFASLFAYLGADLMYKDWNLMEHFIVNEYHKALSSDSQKNPRPMSAYVEQPQEIVKLFDTVSYSKAASVIRMMQHALGETNFKAALQKYLNKMQSKAAEEKDLFDAMQKTVYEAKYKLPGHIEEIMGCWTSQGGYPLLTVVRNYDKEGTFTIQQEPFSKGEEKEDKRKWWIPYNYVAANNPDFLTTTPDGYLESSETQKTITPPANKKISNDDWLIVNKQLTGYYRVHYDEKNWNLISKALKQDHTKIHTYNRAQLIFDAFELSLKKKLSLSNLFDLMSYLEKEEDYGPWAAANGILSAFNQIIKGEKKYGSYQNYIRRLVENTYHKFGLLDKSTDRHFDKYIRAIVVNWACAAGSETCLQNTNENLKDLVEKGVEIKPNMQAIIYCNGLMKANDKEFNYMFNRLLKSLNQAERQMIISSLGCSLNSNQLKKFAESSIILDNTLKSQERVNILKSIYSKSETGLFAVISFLTKNFDKYSELKPAFGSNSTLNDAIIGMANVIVNKNQDEELKKLVKLIENHPKVEKNLLKHVETITKPTLEWINKNGKDIFDSLYKFEKGFRLPKNSKPIEYNVHLVTDVHKSLFNFTGNVTILLEALEESDFIKINYRKLEILKSTTKLTDDNGKNDINIIDIKLDNETDTVTFVLEQKLVPKKKYKLFIDYKGELRDDNAGFYKSLSKKDDKNSIYIATTQFESTDARHGFPCYDEPHLKAKFSIIITHGKNYTAISNMPTIDGSPTSDGNYATTKFQKTPKMSTYLIAFVVSNFKFTEGSLKEKGFVQRVFSRPETKTQQKFALDSGLKILNGIENYLGVNFTLPKMDQVAVPDFAAGAMENWGLVTYREELLLYDEKKSTINTKTAIATTISHEYGHQWFGNLVSPKWWEYLWLNEGFASLFAYLGTNMVYPKWDIMEYFIIQEYQKALNNDAGKNPRPMTHYVEKPKEIMTLFDVVSYSKAASVIRMMQHALGEDIFRKGLTKYLNTMKTEAADENDLFNALQVTPKENGKILAATIKEIMGSWTQQGGYPLLTVERNYEDSSFKISQEWFSNILDAEKNSSKLWYIPFNFVTSNKPDFNSTSPFEYFSVKSIEIKPKTNETFSANDWLILNKQTTGYYRVNYDEQNWNLILAALKKDHKVIHKYNRVQLLSDAYQMNLVKKIKLDFLFDLMTYLENEEEYAPWSIANTILNYFNDYLREQKEYSSFKFYIKTLINKIYTKLSLDEKENDRHFDKSIRTIAINWACRAEIDSCLKDTKQKIKNFVDKKELIEPNLQSAVYCNGLKNAEDKEFNFMYNGLIKSDDQAERQLLMSSLACTENSKQLKKLVESTINKSSGLRPQERLNVLGYVINRGGQGFSVAYEFLLKNFDDYSKLPAFGGADPLNAAITAMSKQVLNESQKDKMKELLQKVKGHPTLDENIAEIVEINVKKNLNWISENKEKLFDWMNSFEKKAKKEDEENKDEDNSAAHMTISLAVITISLLNGFRCLL